MFILRVERRAHIAFNGILGIVIIIADGLGPFVSADGAGAVALSVIGVAHLDLGPDVQPCRAGGTLIAEIAGRLEIVDRQVVITLLEEQEPEMVIDPGV